MQTFFAIQQNLTLHMFFSAEKLSLEIQTTIREILEAEVDLLLRYASLHRPFIAEGRLQFELKNQIDYFAIN